MARQIRQIKLVGENHKGDFDANASGVVLGGTVYADCDVCNVDFSVYYG